MRTSAARRRHVLRRGPGPSDRRVSRRRQRLRAVDRDEPRRRPQRAPSTARTATTTSTATAAPTCSTAGRATTCSRRTTAPRTRRHVRGGPGVDTLQTGNPTGAIGRSRSRSTTSPTTAIPARATTTPSDLENLSATQTAPPIHFTGNDGPNDVPAAQRGRGHRARPGRQRPHRRRQRQRPTRRRRGDDTILGGGGDDVIVERDPSTTRSRVKAPGAASSRPCRGNDDDRRPRRACAKRSTAGRAPTRPSSTRSRPRAAGPGSLCEAVQRPPVIAAAKLGRLELEGAEPQAGDRSELWRARRARRPCAGKLDAQAAADGRRSAARSTRSAAGKSKRVRVNLDRQGPSADAQGPSGSACGSRVAPRAVPRKSGRP